MLAGSFEMTQGGMNCSKPGGEVIWGKESKRLTTHAPGFSIEDGHHTQSVQGPLSMCSSLASSLELVSKDGITEQGTRP